MGQEVAPGRVERTAWLEGADALPVDQDRAVTEADLESALVRELELEGSLGPAHGDLFGYDLADLRLGGEGGETGRQAEGQDDSRKQTLKHNDALGNGGR